MGNVMIHGSELISVFIAQAGYVDLQGGDGGGGDAGHIPAGVRIISVTLFVKCTKSMQGAEDSVGPFLSGCRFNRLK